MPINYTINLNTEYQRYEALAASVSYYGYLNTLSPVSDSDFNFSIKKTYYIGQVQYSSWADSNSFDSCWTDRASYFATPSAVTTITSTSSFDGTKNNIRVSWTPIAGATKYNVTLSGGPYNTGITYLADALSSAVLNPEHKSNVLAFQPPASSCILQNVATGSTYYFTVQPLNNYGASTASTSSLSI